jgi:AraC-like DNA-binding protein
MALFSALISIDLMDKGKSAVEVSFLVSAAAVISMVFQPVAGMLQDRGNRKVVTAVLLLVSAVTGVLFSLQNQYGVLVMFYGAAMALMNSANPYIEMTATKSPYSYRSNRIWGSIGYALGAQVCGIIYEAVSPESNYLSTLFKREMGLPISEYILSKKIESAENILKFTDIPYAEIASILAFSSRSHFIRTFKKYMGLTPREYRGRNSYRMELMKLA